MSSAAELRSNGADAPSIRSRQGSNHPSNRSAHRDSYHGSYRGSHHGSHPSQDPNEDRGVGQDSDSDDDDDDNAKKGEVRAVHGIKWVFVCAAVYIAIFTYGLDTTIAADVQNSVVQDFCGVEQISWLGTGFFLGSIATILPIGALGERFSLKWTFVVCIVIFEVGSVICGAAPNMNALIVGRVIAGVGGSGVYLGALTYLSAVTVPSERGGYISAVGLCWGTGAVLGPVIGGAFAGSSATWRWAFYINLLIAAVCAPVYLTMPNVQPMPDATIRERLLSIDWLGTLLNAGVWAAFVILFTFSGAQWGPWNDGRTIAMFVVFGILLIIFLAQQTFSIGVKKENRIFPCHLMKSRTHILFTTCTSASASAMFVPIYYIPLFSQFVNDDSPILAAVRLLPYLVVAMVMNLAMGILIGKIKLYAPMYLISGIFIMIGSGPLYTWTPQTPLSQIYGLSVLVAFGAGLMLQVGYTLAGVKVAQAGRPQDIPGAIAMQNVGQIGGGTIALVTSNKAFSTKAVQLLTVTLARYNLSQTDLSSAVAGAQSDVFQRLSPEDRAAATYDITRALASIWIMMMAAGAVIIISSVLMKWERVNIG